MVSGVELPGDIQELYPFQGSFAHIGGHRLHYLDEGSGPVIVMLHGNPTWSFYYRRAARELSVKYRVIVPDHIGCGLSDNPTDKEYNYSLDSRVSDLEQLIDSLQLSAPFTLMVHDWGGMIGLAYAVRHPERISRIVLSNTAGFPLPAGRSLPAALTLARLPFVSAFLIRGLNLFCRGGVRFCVTRQPMTRATRRGYLHPYRNWRSRRAVHRFIQDIPLHPGDPSFALVGKVAAGLESLRQVPRLVMWGGRDFVFDKHFLSQWHTVWPDATFCHLPDAGHYLLEDAWPECRVALNDFLSRTESGCDA